MAKKKKIQKEKNKPVLKKTQTGKVKEPESTVSIPIKTISAAKKEQKKQPRVEEKNKESLFDEEIIVEKEDVVEERIIPEGEKKENKLKKKEKDKKNKKKKLSKKAKIWIIVGSLLGVLAIAGIVLRIVLGGGGVFEGNNIIFEVEGPEKAVAGSEVSYQVNFENKEEIALDNVTINIVYPNNFVLSDASPKATNFNESKWGPKTIDPGESFDIKLKGKIIGSEGEEGKLLARVEYKPRNFSSSFSEEMEVKTVLESLKTDLNFSFPDSITSGGEFTLNIEVKNVFDQDLENLRLKLEYPSSFEFKSSKPRPDLNFDNFDIKKIEKNKSELIQVRGVLLGGPSDKNEIKAIVGLVNDKNDFFPQVEKTAEIKISEVLANLETLIYGTMENAMSPGETLEYKVKYKNAGTEPFKEVTIETVVDTKYLNMDSFIIENGGKRDNGRVYWDKDSFKPLEKVNPNDEGEFSFKVRIADNIEVKKQEDTNFMIKARSFFRAKGTESNPDKPMVVESKNAVTKINSQISLDVESHYYDFEGRKVGNGPIPPAVGKKTVYRVYVLLSNKLNEVDEGQVEIVFPEGVTLTGNKSTNVGTITLEKQKATWKIGKIPAGTGQFSQNLEAYIDVSLIPSVSQVGSVVSLTTEPIFIGKDVFTGKKIGSKTGSVTTDLINDPFAQGKGVVVEKEIEFNNQNNLGINEPENINENQDELPIR